MITSQLPLKEQIDAVESYMARHRSITDQKAKVECGVSSLPPVIEWRRVEGARIYEKIYYPVDSNPIRVFSLCDMENPDTDCVSHVADLESMYMGDKHGH
jgi:hypothetical protein